jgi:hypothetical protein
VARQQAVLAHRAWVRHVLVFGLLLALFLLLITRNVSSEPYVYDEADYMYAASLGFAANWTDALSIPITDFARAGLHGNSRQSLSEHVRSSNDVLFYRHFHGPLFHYLLISVVHLGFSEHVVRTALLAIPAASLAVIYFGCLWLASGTRAPVSALLAAMLFLSSYSVIWSTELAPHQLFALCSLATLILLLKAIVTANRFHWYCAVVTAGLAFCTLEIGVMLLLTLGICGFVERPCWRADIGFIAKSLTLFFATVLVVWPAALLRLSFLKAYAVLVYLAWSRQSPWGNVTLAETWCERVLRSPLELTLILAGPILLFRKPEIYPVGIFAALMLTATLRVLTSTPRYSLTFLPALDLLAGLALVPSLGPLRRPASFAVVALAVAGLYANAWYQVVRQPHNPNPRSAAVVTCIHQNELENKAILVPQADLPTLHYYFPAVRLRGYFGPAPTASDREGFAGDAILYAGDPVRVDRIR